MGSKRHFDHQLVSSSGALATSDMPDGLTSSLMSELDRLLRAGNCPLEPVGTDKNLCDIHGRHHIMGGPVYWDSASGVVPGTTLMIGGGKWGILYPIDRDAAGTYSFRQGEKVYSESRRTPKRPKSPGRLAPEPLTRSMADVD